MNDDFQPYLARLKQARPRVHIIIGAITAPFVVDVLAAIGARPTVTHEAEQAAEFAAGADTLLINLAQLDRPRMDGARAAVEAIRQKARSWVLDPAMVQRSATRLAFARKLLALSPDVIKLNPEELAALNDGDDSPEKLALKSGGLVFLTGARPCLTNGGLTMPLPGLPQLAGQVGYGCALGAMVAAFLARETPQTAIERAYKAFSLAVAWAGEAGNGPASFRVAFVDALWRLGEEGTG